MSITHSQPLIGHLLELRDRLLRSVAAILVAFLALVYFANDIYSFVAQPLLAVLPEGGAMIATDVAAPFFTPIKLTIVTAVFATVPYWLSQVWAFIAPGLYKNERRMLIPLIFGSAALFYLGAAFAYYVVFPLAFAFFATVAPEGVSIATDISSYLSFVLKLFFAFGLAFQIPVATLLMCWSGMSSPQSLANKRSHVIVGVFVVGMLLTPPDVISQTLLALPMWLLFEAGLVMARFYKPNKADIQNNENLRENHPSLYETNH
ncbi:twin-arginine protein translocation system subunit TatC [Photobacterium jeanii]|uniref:Sec-independent protein translocase protein TatC n=1 Tax=Photobacterium jeanii TaxID=858640 RepID=A0A178KM26_9GAMM|nr:twin-arginine translocase subunit TatC [Photobacterium jeanii]OAN17804.1 twin-arginine protein translocation system subunit TatC [Photobacterium jeanii]PST92530.1 twin-arginine translocase subunit TatC [Photobacterium jeanii]